MNQLIATSVNLIDVIEVLGVIVLILIIFTGLKRFF